MLFQQLLNGLTLGSIYALIALGYTIIFGVLLLINFAQGEVFMMGAMVGLAVTSILLYALPAGLAGSPVVLLLGILGATVACGVLGILVERIGVRPLRAAPRIYALITTLGISMILQNTIMLTVGSSNIPFPQLAFNERYYAGGAYFSMGQVLIIAICGILMYGVHLIVSSTRLGAAMRATRDDRMMARLVGIRTDRIIVLSFVLASVLAAVAGPLYSMNYGVAKFDMGYLLGVKAFTAAIFGGIGNLYGAMVGGLVIGLVESLTAGYVSADYKDVFVFVALILILLFKPRGLLGERVAQAR